MIATETATGATVGEHTLVVRDLRKHFGSVKANDGLNLEFASSEVHALLGENGAGKSTLIKIFAGIYRPDSGSITLDGESLAIGDAMAARRSGISVVHQDSTLVPRLTALENVMLQEGGLGRFPPDLSTRLIASGRRLGFELDPAARVETLTPGDRQRVEMARALMVDARFLILDEPTAVLSPEEKETFFGLLQRLAADGLGIIVVTHHIGDALKYGQRVTILRGGRVVGEPRASTHGLTERAVIQRMVGEVELREDHRAGAAPGPEVVRITDIHGQFEGERSLHGVSLSVRAGEVLGIAGVEGDGQRELAAALTGAWTPPRGSVTIDGRPMAKLSPAERAEMIADVPDDQLLGTVAEIGVWQNIGLTRLAWKRRRTPRESRRLRTETVGLIDAFGIRAAGVNAPVGQLSGGNRRRVVLARELSKQPRLAVLGFASKGLDVRSVEQLKEWTRRLAAAGTAVVYISADLDEVLAISDRVAVLADGTIQGILEAHEADVHSIGRLMLGAKEAGEAGS